MVFSSSIICSFARKRLLDSIFSGLSHIVRPVICGNRRHLIEIYSMHALDNSETHSVLDAAKCEAGLNTPENLLLTGFTSFKPSIPHILVIFCRISSWFCSVSLYFRAVCANRFRSLKSNLSVISATTSSGR